MFLNPINQRSWLDQLYSKNAGYWITKNIQDRLLFLFSIQNLISLHRGPLLSSFGNGD